MAEVREDRPSATSGRRAAEKTPWEDGMRHRLAGAISAVVLGAAVLAGPGAAGAATELTFWSHWAAEMPKRSFVESAIADFEAKNPDIKIKTT